MPRRLLRPIEQGARFIAEHATTEGRAAHAKIRQLKPQIKAKQQQVRNIRTLQRTEQGGAIGGFSMRAASELATRRKK